MNGAYSTNGGLRYYQWGLRVLQMEECFYQWGEVYTTNEGVPCAYLTMWEGESYLCMWPMGHENLPICVCKQLTEPFIKQRVKITGNSIIILSVESATDESCGTNETLTQWPEEGWITRILYVCVSDVWSMFSRRKGHVALVFE